MLAPESIRSLDELLDRLKWAPLDNLDGELAEYAEAFGLPLAHGEIDMSALPTFGGEAPTDDPGVWSWDATRALVGSCMDDLEIINRVDGWWAREGERTPGAPEEQ